MHDLLDDWLRARDAASLQRAWSAVPALAVDAAPTTTGGVYYTGGGAARLASAMLGWDAASLAWLEALPDAMTQAGAPPPTYATRRTVPHCYLERELDLHERCDETWELRERREGPRVVQWLHVGFSIEDGSRDGRGSGGTAVRIADLAAGVGACVLVHSPRASVVARDPARLAGLASIARGALDVFEDTLACELPLPYERATAVRWFADACAGFDPSFAGAAGWPVPAHEARALRNSRGEFVAREVNLRCAAPDQAGRAFTLNEVTPPTSAECADPLSVWVTLTAEGLAGGCFVEVNLQEIKAPRRPSLRATVRVRGPRRDVEALRERLRPGARV